MAVSVIIGGIVFRTKGESKQFFGGIRDRYPDGAQLGAEDDALLRELLACHPEASEKVGSGVAYFTVDTDRHSDGRGISRCTEWTAVPPTL